LFCSIETLAKQDGRLAVHIDVWSLDAAAADSTGAAAIQAGHIANALAETGLVPNVRARVLPATAASEIKAACAAAGTFGANTKKALAVLNREVAAGSSLGLVVLPACGAAGASATPLALQGRAGVIVGSTADAGVVDAVVEAVIGVPRRPGAAAATLVAADSNVRNQEWPKDKYHVTVSLLITNPDTACRVEAPDMKAAIAQAFEPLVSSLKGAVELETSSQVLYYSSIPVAPEYVGRAQLRPVVASPQGASGGWVCVCVCVCVCSSLLYR